MGIERDQPAVDFRDLAQGVGALPVGLALGVGRGPLDQDHVAGLQHGPRLFRLGAHLLAFEPGPGPGQLGHRDMPGGAVGEADLGPLGIETEHHRERPGGAPLGRLDRGQERAPVAGFEVPFGHRAAPAVAPVVGDQALAQDPLGDALEPGIERGAHRQAALVEAGLAIDLGQLAPDLLDEIIGPHDLGRVHPVHAQRLGPSLLGLGEADAPVLEHAPDHPVAPGQRGLGAPDRMIVVRRLGQRRHVGRLGDAQLVERLVEIIERGGRHAIGAEAQVNLVQVEIQDPVLVEGALDAEGEDGFLDLAGHGHLVGQQEVLGDLLGDRRGADRPPVPAQIRHVGHDRAGNRDEVHARVAVEVLVLGRQEGVDHAPRDRLDRHVDALLGGVFDQQPAVAGMQAGDGRRLVVGELPVVRQVPPIVIEYEEHARAPQQREKQKHADKACEEPQFGLRSDRRAPGTTCRPRPGATIAPQGLPTGNQNHRAFGHG